MRARLAARLLRPLLARPAAGPLGPLLARRMRWPTTARLSCLPRLYDRRAMVRRSRARWLAPIALAAVIAGTYLIVHARLSDKSTSTQTQARHTSRVPRKYAKVKFYVIQPGDTLTIIARKTGIPIATLEALNPNVDPTALQTSQKLRLRR